MKGLRGNLMLMLTALIWGTAFVAQSVGMDYIGPYTFLCTRSIIGGIFLIPCMIFLKKFNNREGGLEKKQDVKKLITGGIFCGIALFTASSLQQIGIIYTSVGKAGFITALYIILVPILGLILGKKAGIKVWIAVLMSLFGLYMLCVNEGFSINKGDILLFLCAVFFAVHILVIDYFSSKVDGVKMSCIQFFVCGIISAVFMFIFEKWDINAVINAAMPILYAGVMSSGIAYTLQIVAQKYTEPVVASLIMSLESVFAVLGGWIILHEVLSFKEMAGCILVFTGIILTQLPDKKELWH